MSGDDSEPTQLRFEDGEVVRRADEDTATPERDRSPPEQPGTRTGFDVAVKDDALEANTALANVVETHGRTLTFGSRTHAERYAVHLSADGGSLRVQAAAPNDPSEVDAYLLADHNPSIKEPAEINDKTWTFDVGANLYGALGEAILLEPPKPHALFYFVRKDLNVDEDDPEWGLNVDVTSGRLLSIDSSGETMQWTPDCVVEAKDGWNGELLERYYCEIKTGNASFERTQVDAMEALATDKRVLKIRVIIEDLPDQYSLRIHEVNPPA